MATQQSQSASPTAKIVPLREQTGPALGHTAGQGGSLLCLPGCVSPSHEEFQGL